MFENHAVNLGLVRKPSKENLIPCNFNFNMALLLMCNSEMSSCRQMIKEVSLLFIQLSQTCIMKFEKTGTSLYVCVTKRLFNLSKMF